MQPKDDASLSLPQHPTLPHSPPAPFQQSPVHPSHNPRVPFPQSMHPSHNSLRLLTTSHAPFPQHRTPFPQSPSPFTQPTTPSYELPNPFHNPLHPTHNPLHPFRNFSSVIDNHINPPTISRSVDLLGLCFLLARSSRIPQNSFPEAHPHVNTTQFVIGLVLLIFYQVNAQKRQFHWLRKFEYFVVHFCRKILGSLICKE